MKFYLDMNSDDNSDTAQPPVPSNEENHDAEIADVSDEDVERLNDQLDELNSALDVLEEKNENIQARLKELLQSSRELRNDQTKNQLHLGKKSVSAQKWHSPRKKEEHFNIKFRF